MNIFYTPDITGTTYTLSEDESRHAVKVLRLGTGDTIYLTDGRGNLYTGVIEEASPKKCLAAVQSVEHGYGKRPYNLTMAVAPTKNAERYEWFLEKATEIGCDVFIPVECEHSERRVLKHDRSMRVVTSAVKQSLKAYHPELTPMQSFREVAAMPFAGNKLIAHCEKGLERTLLKEVLTPGGDVMILIGPEGDFSPEEITFAVSHGFRPVSFGESRLRTETAALFAVAAVALANQ